MEYILVRPREERPLEAVLLTRENADEIVHRINGFPDFIDAQVTQGSDQHIVYWVFGEFKNTIQFGNWVVFSEFGLEHGSPASFAEDFVPVDTSIGQE